ncbi:MAG: hypothetical protein DRN14_06395, partial [Thermoplasmata archaeon]
MQPRRKEQLATLALSTALLLLLCFKPYEFWVAKEAPRITRYCYNDSFNATHCLLVAQYKGFVIETPEWTKCVWSGSNQPRVCRHWFRVKADQDIQLRSEMFKKLAKFAKQHDKVYYHFLGRRFTKQELLRFINETKPWLRKNEPVKFEVEFVFRGPEKWNFTLMALDSTEINIDPTVSGCTDITSSGEYYLDQDIVDSGTSYCINISANDVVFDCQGHKVDGDDSASYGIYIYRSASQTTNITIKNCEVSDWDTANIHVQAAEGNTFENITTFSSPGHGIRLVSDFNTFTNITVHSNDDRGIYLYYADSNTFTNIVTHSNGYYGFDFLYADFNTLSNVSAHSNGYHGIYLYGSDSNTIKNSKIYNNPDYGIKLYNAGKDGANSIYNNFFNNTNNIYFGGTIYHNDWNTTKQEGNNIYDPNNPYIGGNFWAEPDGTGYSETCDDADLDGFCDEPYTLATNNIDYLPISTNYEEEPAVIYVNLTPDQPGSSDDLHLNATCVWWDTQENLTAYWKIYKDGVEQTELSGSKEVEHNVNTLLIIIGSGNTSEFQNWTAEVWCGNETYNSTSKNDSVVIADSIPPAYSDSSTNTTQAGALTEFRVKWTDNANLTGGGGFIFSWHNGANWTKISSSDDLESGTQSFSEKTATYTFFDDFESGTLSENWETYSSDATYGRIGVRTEDAHSGSYAVIADVSENGHDNLNELITNYDFSEATEVILTFWHREWGDEETSGADHSGHYNSDAVYFTCDGSYWYHLQDLGNIGSTWTEVTINITAHPNWCGEANSSFKIKFTQYDNYALTSDGRGFDDINITYTTVGGQEANKTPVEYSVSLSTYEHLDNITIVVHVSYYNNSGSQANNNNNPALWLELYNSTDWVDGGDFQVNDEGNFSLTITNQNVLTAWKNESNRLIRISARYMDYNDSEHYDTIEWDGVWIKIGSHQEFLNDTFREFNSSNCANDTVC